MEGRAEAQTLFHRNLLAKAEGLTAQAIKGIEMLHFVLFITLLDSCIHFFLLYNTVQI